MRPSHPPAERSESTACIAQAGTAALPLEVRLPACGTELSTARKHAHEVASAFGLAPSACYGFVFAVNEAVTNAIMHGEPDEDGAITLRFTVEGDRLTCAVEDRGTFTPPSRALGHWTEHGRGLTLMAKLVDDLRLAIRSGTTTVRLSADRSRGQVRPGSPVADHADAAA